MTWALYSTMEDMEKVAAGFKEVGLTAAQRRKLRDYWNGGLSTWQSAPCIPAEHPCFATDGVESVPGGTCMRRIVMTFGTLADFRGLLRTLIGKNPDAAYYTWLEPFLANGWYGVDPDPPAAGYWDGRVCR